ncbi:hypothetical protein CUC08_Gglean013224 [Alternaria sp. MG1]|nr:hypothetical protein CUC08_Gglean013224 [Alternaria sp. MG1]
MAVGQPQMAEFDHPQQRHTNECNESMNQSQVPGGNAQPQHDMMGGVQSQGANTSAASSSSSAMNPSLENHSRATRRDRRPKRPGRTHTRRGPAVLHHRSEVARH